MAGRLQILVSAVKKDTSFLPEKMNIQTDAVIVNQFPGEKGTSADICTDYKGCTLKVLERYEKGVGLSRNTALEASEAEIIQFGDDDIVYDDNYPQKVLEEFDRHKEADMLLFNVKAQEGRETSWNDDYSRINWKNYGRYPAYAIFARRKTLLDSGVRFSLLFGGGAPYMNGEDSLFLHDCLKAGLNIYRTTVSVGHEVSGESTWFKGYTEKFFFDRGVLYHFLYGKIAKVLGFRFLFNNRKAMCADMGLFRSFSLLVKGVDHGKKLKKV